MLPNQILNRSHNKIFRLALCFVFCIGLLASSQSVMASVTNDEEMFNDLVEEVLGEIQETVNIEFTFAELLPEEYARYGVLLQQIEATGDTNSLTMLVDIGISGISKYCWSDNPNFAYNLCSKLLSDIDKVRYAITADENTLTLETYRLLIWKLRTEWLWGGVLDGISDFDEYEAETHFVQLQELELSREVDTYRLKELLIEGQKSFLGTLTDARPLINLINSQPVSENIRDQISTARNKAWALVECARILPSNEEWVSMKALLQQYAADYVAIQVEELEDSVNLTDTKYFNDVVREACEKLVQTRIQAELLGIDVNESSLADRLPVNDYLIRDDLFG